MRKHGTNLSAAALAAALVVLATAGVSVAAPTVSQPSAATTQDRDAHLQLAESSGSKRHELQPRYEPAPLRPRKTFNDEYIFGLTRGVAESTMHPSVKILMFPVTVPLDFLLLPFEIIGGTFG